jgi:hypothetical protein
MNQRRPRETTVEVETNAIKLRNKIIDNDDVCLISHQTGIKDDVLIKRVLCECQNDIARTIIKLLDIQNRIDQHSEDDVKEPTVFDRIRGILDDKDRIFHEVMKPKPAPPTLT